jgi:hypothetical protein
MRGAGRQVPIKTCFHLSPFTGWRASFLTSVVAPGELPASLKTWTRPLHIRAQGQFGARAGNGNFESSNQRFDTLMQDRSPPTHQNLVATPDHAWVESAEIAMSSVRPFLPRLPTSRHAATRVVWGANFWRGFRTICFPRASEVGQVSMHAPARARRYRFGNRIDIDCVSIHAPSGR